MSARTYWATRYGLLALTRDRPLLFLALVLPIATMMLGGIVFSHGLANVPLCITNEDVGPYGAKLVTEFDRSARFAMTAADRTACDELLRKGTVAATVAIEANHTGRLSTEGRVDATVTVDNSLPFLGWLTMLECRKVLYAHLLDTFANDPTPALLHMRENDPFLGWVYGQVSSFITPERVYFIIGALLGAQERLVHLDPVFLHYYLPGLLTIAIIFTATTLASILVVRDREDGSLTRLLASPLSPGEYLASRMAVALLVSLVQAAIILGVLGWYLGTKLSLLSLFVVLAVLALASCALGILVSTMAGNALHALEVAVLIIVVQILLGSMVFPNVIMPDAVRSIEPLLPATHSVAALREVILWKEPAAAQGPLTTLVGLAAVWWGAAWLLLTYREQR